jgi:glycosyl transferase family 25
MRVHVINLESSVARRAKIEKRLLELGIDYSIERGVAGRDGYTYFEECDLWRYWLNTGRSPNEGEIGCYASHLLLWKHCVTSGESIVVMEDDALPLPTLPAALQEARRLIDRYGFLRLDYDGPSRPARTREIESTGTFSVHYFDRYPYGAMCYALSPPVASVLAEHSRILRAPVDQFIKRCWEHGQPLYGLLPYSVIEGSEALASTIRGRDKELPPPGRRARRLLHKLQTVIRRAAFNRRSLRLSSVQKDADIGDERSRGDR